MLYFLSYVYILFAQICKEMLGMMTSFHFWALDRGSCDLSPLWSQQMIAEKVSEPFKVLSFSP